MKNIFKIVTIGLLMTACGNVTRNQDESVGPSMPYAASYAGDEVVSDPQPEAGAPSVTTGGTANAQAAGTGGTNDNVIGGETAAGIGGSGSDAGGSSEEQEGDGFVSIRYEEGSFPEQIVTSSNEENVFSYFARYFIYNGTDHDVEIATFDVVANTSSNTYATYDFVRIDVGDEFGPGFASISAERSVDKAYNWNHLRHDLGVMHLPVVGSIRVRAGNGAFIITAGQLAAVRSASQDASTEEPDPRSGDQMNLRITGFATRTGDPIIIEPSSPPFKMLRKSKPTIVAEPLDGMSLYNGGPQNLAHFSVFAAGGDVQIDQFGFDVMLSSGVTVGLCSLREATKGVLKTDMVWNPDSQVRVHLRDPLFVAEGQNLNLTLECGISGVTVGSTVTTKFSQGTLNDVPSVTGYLVVDRGFGLWDAGISTDEPNGLPPTPLSGTETSALYWSDGSSGSDHLDGYGTKDWMTDQSISYLGWTQTLAR